MTKADPIQGTHFQPFTRAAALQRLDAFLPRAGFAYARDRNRDLPGHAAVSRLSPYLRHRLIIEAEVLNRVADMHGEAAEKFTAEVLWRSYWKGFLELRPGLWTGYRRDLQAALNRLAVEPGLRKTWEAACEGATGIEGFDHWAQELVETGYLHNLARMWFASIWIFTLRLPWELGADFFLRHLLDGDPASNTLSWRWVAGLHTPGKTYAATAENIAKNTAGRFRPEGLAKTASAIAGRPNPGPGPCPEGDSWDPSAPSLLLVHEDDLSPEWLLKAGLTPKALCLTMAPEGRSPLMPSLALAQHLQQGLDDCADRLSARLGTSIPIMQATDLAKDLPRIAQRAGAVQIVTPHAPVGPMAEALDEAIPTLAQAGLRLARIMRDYDRRLWPHATHGFFRFREAVGTGPF